MKKDILSENEGEGEYEANVEEPSTCLFSIDEFVQYFIQKNRPNITSAEFHYFSISEFIAVNTTLTLSFEIL